MYNKQKGSTKIMKHVGKKQIRRRIYKIMQWLCAGVAIVGLAGMLTTNPESDVWLVMLLVSFGMFISGFAGYWVFKNPKRFLNTCYAVVAVIYVWLHRHDKKFMQIVENRCGKPISYKDVFSFVQTHI